MQELWKLTATQAVALLRRREVSPLELLDAAQARIAATNPQINALVTLCFERARKHAQRIMQADPAAAPPQFLHGLPIAVKDNTDVEGVRCTFGSRVHADRISPASDIVVQRLEANGALVVGKTNLPEFAAGGNTFNEVFGRTRNPWDPSRSAGGSTGGGAAALATGMIALAEGTDLGGSLRIPASFCGVVGLRPSVGLVPTHPTDWAWDTLQVSGPMARTAEDVALMLSAVSGPTESSPVAQAHAGRDFVRLVQDGPARGVRIGYCADPAGIGVDSEIERICRDTAFRLRDAGAQVEEVEIDLSAARGAFLALRGLWFLTHMLPRLEREAEFGVNVGNNVRAGRQLSALDLAHAEQERGRVWHLLRAWFQRLDFIVTPCMAVPPFPVEQNYPETIAGKTMQNYVDWIAPTFVWSLTGLPVAAVPAGRDRAGLPVGLQVVGRPRADGEVLAVAGAVTRLAPIGPPPR
jgi:amidase